MTSSVVGGVTSAASHTWTNRNHSTGSDASWSSDEFDRKKCKASTTIPAFGRPALVDDRSRSSLRSPTSIHEGNSRSTVRPKSRGEITQPAEVFSRPIPVGIGKLGDDVPGTDRRGRLEQPDEVVGFFVRPQASELDVEHLHAGVGQTIAHTGDHRPIADQ